MTRTEPLTSDYQAYVDADAVLAYALATEDPNELCRTGAVAPPLFTATLVVQAFTDTMSTAVPDGAITGTRASVHGMHDVHYYAPVIPGSKVRITGRHHGVKQTPAGVVISTELSVEDLDGTLLLKHYWTGMNVGGVVDFERGEDLPDHLFPDHARERPIGTHVIDIAPDQAFRYGGASGDRNGHAINDEIARAEGFPSKILQGLCTFAMCSGAVVKLVGDGDPRNLTRLAGRFSSPVFPRQQLEVALFDAGTREDGTRLVAFEATSNGVTVVKHGRAELRN